MVFISLASVGLPGLNGFVGEMLSLAGMFRRQPVYTVLGATGVILGAWYLLNMLQHVFFGPLREPHVGESAAADSHHVRGGGRDDEPPISDITPREMLAIGPICALCLWIGVMPQPLIELIRPDVDAIVTLYTADERGMASADRQNMGAEHGASKHHTRRLGIRDVPRGKAPDNMPRVADWPSSPQSSAVTESRPAVTALGPRLSALISQPSTLNPPQ
jgi:NADH-quinone oxidoreductase subunit M